MPVKITHIALGALVTLGVAFLAINPGRLERDRMETAVAAKLRDPGSAEFRNIRKGTRATCGEVNGKNAFGAYVGFKSFVFINGVALFEPEKPIASNLRDQSAYYDEATTFWRTKRKCYE